MANATLDLDFDKAAAKSISRRDNAAGSPTSKQPGRIATKTAAIDQSQTISFTWEGDKLAAHPGDTLASALLANGVRLTSRSFKYHRPRGVMSAGVEEGGAIVTVGEGARKTPNTNAATCEMFDGLVAHGQNAWPSLRHDIGSVNNFASPFFGAGFYYKTFFSVSPFGSKGTKQWMWYETLIRKAAGMGRMSREPDPDHYETAHAFCDVLVVGSGPAGLEAARVAAEAGLDVILAEQDFALGGGLLSETRSIEGAAAAGWRSAKLAALTAAGVRIMDRTTVFGLYDGGVAGLVQRVSDHISAPDPDSIRQRVWTVRSEHTVLATGAVERTIAFGDNDRPGVMTAGAARTYLNRFGVMAGRKVVVATTNDSGRVAAADFAAAGAEVTLLDARESVGAAPDGVAQRLGFAPLRSLGGFGVKGVEIARDTATGWRREDELDCDLLAVSGGWSPVVNLLSHRGVKPVWSDEHAAFLPGETAEPIHCAGAATGLMDLDASAASGRNAAATILGRPTEPLEEAPTHVEEVYEVRVPDRKLKSFVDPQHDVTTKDIRQAHQEGYVSVEHLKRYTTLGMANDQGRNGNVIGLALMAEARGIDIPDVGTTTFRPPFTPVSIGALAGQARGAHFRPLRRSPMDAWNLGEGATMTDAGLWRRPWFYPQKTEDGVEDIDAAYIREATVVRETVGLCDVTSLGKIAVQGPDAAEFLNRVYTNGFAKLAVGRARYGVMLREDGLAMDDGTVWRMAEHDYFMTTTTAGAGQVMSWLELLLETRWQDLRVAVTSVSERWAGMAVAGPHARNVLKSVVTDIDFEDESFPFMGVREGTLGGALCRVARISFSGEFAYEIYVESDHGAAMAAALWDAAKPLGGVLYGTEALGALRIEKGHVTHSEIDGRTTIEDIGLGKMASTKKSYVGSALKDRATLRDVNRPQLVGLKPTDTDDVFKAGAILRREGNMRGHGLGWVSSVTHSPALGHWIGLGLLEGGVERWEGRTIVADDPARGKLTKVTVISPHMFDLEGARLKPEMDPPTGVELPAAPLALPQRSALGTLWPVQDMPAVRGRAELDDVEDPNPQTGDAAAWVVECAPKPLWQATAWPDRKSVVEDALLEAAGADAAPKPGRLAIGEDDIKILRVAPLVWWVEGLAEDDQYAVSQLSAEDGSSLELSHGFTKLLIGGSRAAELLNRFLPLDLRDERFPVGSVATSGMHHAPVTLARETATSYALWLPRSYAKSLWEMLVDAARRMG